MVVFTPVGTLLYTKVVPEVAVPVVVNVMAPLLFPLIHASALLATKVMLGLALTVTVPVAVAVHK